MSRQRRGLPGRRTGRAVALLAAGTATLLWPYLAAAAPGAGDSGNGRNKGVGNDAKDFAIAGRVDGLVPGARRPLALTVTNGNNFAIRVATLSVTVAPGSACPADSLVVSAYQAGSLVVPRNGTATVVLQVAMAPNAPDSCQGVTFRLTYSGTAVKA